MATARPWDPQPELALAHNPGSYAMCHIVKSIIRVKLFAQAAPIPTTFAFLARQGSSGGPPSV